MQLLMKHRGSRGFSSIQQLRAAGISDAVIEKLAEADAFRSLNKDRRKALWDATTRVQPLNLFKDGSEFTEEAVTLPEMELSEHVIHDYASTSLSLKAHPVSFVRPELDRFQITSAASLEKCSDGDFVKVAGLILVRQRPGTASGICFITLEDETGTANLVVFKNLFDRYRKEIIQSRLLMVEGKLQKEGEVIHVVVQRCFNFSKLLHRLFQGKDESQSLNTFSRADERSGPTDTRIKKQGEIEAVQGKIFPEGRNFR
jgi:error-prone DNA polymerase